jgi:ABC-type bacteriocin/lantibiotic exporter with double-glycine peptidase domain
MFLELDRKDITLVFLYAAFSGLITLTLPLGIQAILGLIAGGNISSSWVLLISVVTAGTALTGILKVMQLSVTETIQRRIFTRSAFDIAYRLPKIKFEALHMEYAPELVNRFFDTLTLQKGLPKILMDFSTGILQIFFGLTLMAFYHPLFIILGLALTAVVLLLFRLTGKQGLTTSLKESKYKYEVAYWLEELARTMGTFKLAGQSSLPLQRTDDLVSGYLDARKQHFRVLVSQYSVIVAFKVLVTAGLLILGSLLVIDNRINLGQFVAAEIVVILILASVEKLILTTEVIYDVLTALEKLGTLTDLPIEKEEGICFEEHECKCGMSIELTDLTYYFPGAERPSLDRINLSVRAGEKICIAGYNGSGKSTLLHIITCLYHDFRGSLTFNKVPSRNLNANSLRAYIGDHMPQEEDVFRGTLLQNISMGHERITLDDIMQAVERAGLDPFVKQLPDGFDTLLLPGGKNLPSSVVSKIILARSFAARPALLAIAEPFHLLEQGERERLASQLTGKENAWTLMAISDDPLLASRCDRIIIMQDGRIVQDGSFEEIRTGPHYKFVFQNN